MRRFLLITLLSLVMTFTNTIGGSLAVAAPLETTDERVTKPIYYGDRQIIDNSWQPAIAPWDWEMTHADYNIRVKEDITAGQIIEFSKDGEYITLQPMALEWTNDLSQIQPIAMPSKVTALVGQEQEELLPDVFNDMGWIRWDDTYGSGIDLKWQCTTDTLEKTLDIENYSDLPPPAQYIVDGGNPVLRLSLIFGISDAENINILVDEEVWDKSSQVQTFESIIFEKNGSELWSFKPLSYWDSDGNAGESVATLRKSGNSLYISVMVPYSWLQTASYPVTIDADITIDNNTASDLFAVARRAGIFWTSTTVGYVIYANDAYDLEWNKTSDGGATWDGPWVLVAAASCDAPAYDCWADWQTDGDTGTKIHIAYFSFDTEEIRYVYLDTDGDSVGGDDLIEACQGTGTLIPASLKPAEWQISTTKTRGGNLAVAFRYRDAVAFDLYAMFYTSPDADNWTSRGSPWEATYDYIYLYPANLADNQDLWATFWDTSADEISLKTFDDSNNDWTTIAEASISGSMAEHTDYTQMDGAIRFSDGHLIFAAWSQYDNAASDLMVWDITDAGTITAKTNVITDEAESFLVSVFINQANDDIYIAYTSGAAAQSSVQVFYQLSQDGGANWDGETAMQANAADDERWVSAGAVKATWGGKFLPIWFNDDLNDLFCNTDNGITIAATGVSAPTVVTNAATSVEETTATLSGNITATGGENATERRFQWGTSTGVYTDNWSEAGDFGAGLFTHGITGLTKGELYYYVASANNSADWGTGSEVTFLTKPDPATSFISTDNGTTWIDLSWANGTGMDYVEVRYAEGSAPADNVSGTLGYWGNGTTANVTGLSPGTTYFFIIFTHATEGGLWSTADNSPTCQDTTDAITAPTVVTNAATSVEETTATLSGNITATNGANATARRFQWGTATGVYTDNWTEYGNYGVALFTHGITALTKGELYYYVASANNSAGWGTGSEVTFLTKPDPATSFTSTDNGTSWIDLSWANGTGMDFVEIRYAEGSAPADNVSGTLGYWGNGTTANVTGLNSDTTYFFAIFTHATEGGLWSTADNDPTCQDTTDKSGAVVPTVTTNAATSVEETTATLSGNITATGGDNATARRFQWGTSTGVYTANWTGYGDFGVGQFTHGLTGLTEGELYYYVASANNSAGWGTGAEATFFTKPVEPNSLSSVDLNLQINLTWNMGAGADNITIRGNIGSYPADYNSDTLIYNGTGTSVNHTGLNNCDSWYYRAWSWAGEGALEAWSDTYDQDTGQPYTVPTGTSDNSSGVTSSTAALSGNITGPDCANTERGFQYDQDGAAPFSDNWTEMGTFSGGVFSHEITGLSANTTYYWRTVVINGLGIGYGSTENFTTLVAPDTVPLVPGCFTITDLGGITGEAVWCASANATGYLILVDRDSYPNDPNGDFEVAYSGNATSDNLTSYSLASTQYYFSLWSYNEIGYSDTYLTATIGGENMTLLALGLIPLGLLITMFATKNAMLGFPSALFWAIFGGYAYTQSATPWGDWQYYVAFGSLLGMTSFSALAAYGLREKRDTIADEEMEQGENDKYIGDENAEADIFGENNGPESSERSRRLKERVAKRRSKPMRKGEFGF